MNAGLADASLVHIKASCILFTGMMGQMTGQRGR